ncbi:hypothetical protein HDU83_005014 [Entophlyctis luteolus]|nr:hypothetical protein HDU83_005014 [Entophlyctis luteolus]
MNIASASTGAAAAPMAGFGFSLALPNAASSAAPAVVWNPMMLATPAPQAAAKQHTIKLDPTRYAASAALLSASALPAAPRPRALPAGGPYNDPGNVKFSDLFAPRLKFVKPAIAKRPAKKVPQRSNIYVLSRDDYDVFMGHVPQSSSAASGGIYRSRRRKESMEESAIFSKKTVPESFDPLVLDDWEDRIIWDDRAEKPDQPQKFTTSSIEQESRALVRNVALDADIWTDSIIWDDEENMVPPPIAFVDPTIVNDLKDFATDEVPKPVVSSARKRLMESYNVDKFNLSNDIYYESVKRDQHVRQAQGAAVLRHSKAAVEMMWPHYKTQLTTQELRNFHRPPIKFAPNEEAVFARIKNPKKKKDGVEPFDDFMNLTLKDSANFALLEYSEEYPPILSNFGMGTLIQNFYRKQNEKDMTIPPLEIGQHSPLEKIDASPFNNFGDVPAGEVIQGITNNLIRAPIFRHTIAPTDFLFIRHTFNGKTRYYLRDVPFLFVVGQTYPQQEVPRPQSRKVLNLMKARLHSIAYRLMLNNPNQRLWYPKLAKYYIGQSDLVVRQRLREVAQNWKKGENTGWYKVKQSKSMPTEEELQKIITPEWCCLLETAFAGEQRLKDIGYANIDLGAGGGGEDGEEQDDSNTDLEIQMAPWISTKNFVMTIQGKGMVQLYGEGDPTGIGEGFSFIRQSMKEMFYRQGETPPPQALLTPKNLVRFSYAEQQVVYKEEIRRIWNAQFKSLSSTKKPELAIEEVHDDPEKAIEDKMATSQSDEKSGGHPVAKDDDAMSVADSQAAKKNKKLIINRLVRNAAGEPVWKSEVLTDPRVINAYLRQRLIIESKINAKKEEPPPQPAEEEVKDPTKRRRKKPIDQVITEDMPAVPRRPDATPANAPPASSQSLKLKLSLSSADSKPKYPAGPEGELSRILETIVIDLISMPAAQTFRWPVSKELLPEYYVLVKQPICLEDLRVKCQSMQYKVAEAFLSDINLIYENSALYNGIKNPLTEIASQIVAKAQKSVQQLVVVIGGSGIGRCIAHELASLGAHVFICGRHSNTLSVVANEINSIAGQRCDFFTVDVRDPTAVTQAVSELVEKHGFLSGLVNNAGGQFPSPAEAISDKGWRSVVDLNLNGTWNMLKAVQSVHDQSQPLSIVNITADVRNGKIFMAHTAAARAGVENLAKTLAQEWGGQGIRINCVAPGTIIGNGMRNYADIVKAKTAETHHMLPVGRLGTEAEISAVVVFLLSPASGFITGTTIQVTGGAHLRKGYEDEFIPYTDAFVVPPFFGFETIQSDDGDSSGSGPQKAAYFASGKVPGGFEALLSSWRSDKRPTAAQGGGGLVILKHKSWHVYNESNRERVRKDEEKARAEEDEKKRRAVKADQEHRLNVMRGKATSSKRSRPSDEEFPHKSDTFLTAGMEGVHLHLFGDLESGKSLRRDGSNEEYEAERLAEKTKNEKKFTVYLDGDSATSAKPWYALESSEKGGRNAKKSKRLRLEYDDPASKFMSKDDVEDGLNARRRKVEKKKKAAGSNIKSKSIEELRAERLQREQSERKKANELFSQKPSSRTEQSLPYNSMFNPEFVRKKL